MSNTLTPRQVARALDVSESSVKRWCDSGAIAAQHTAGGHRRIPLSAVVEFIRREKLTLVHPEALGLPATSGQSERVLDRSRERMVNALLVGDEAACRQITVDLYLAEHSLATICDQVFAEAFRQIGNRWACGEAEVYEERRGCEITLRVLHELRAMLPAPPEGAPLALGGAPAGDPYNLGTTMAELVLRDLKWNAVSLGNNLPFVTMGAALRKYRPRLFWLSCSHIADQAEFVAEYQQFYDEFAMDAVFVVGGYALTESVRQHLKYSAFCDSMQRLEGFALSLRTALEKR